MKLLFLDAETYYDDEYSLRKMPPPNYILDPRYEEIMWAAKEDDGVPFLVDAPDFPAFLRQYDPATTTTVTFNALFDNCILAWRHNYIPARILCAMRMAIALRGHELPGASLASVSKSLGVGVKGTEIENVKGMHRADILASGRWHAFTQYALNDVELCARIFFKLWPDFPPQEARVMDHVLRCAIEPGFQIDKVMLTEHLKDLAAEKVQLLAQCGISDPSELRSTAKFEEILRGYGIEPGMKPSITDPSRMIPAFAKTDEFMEALQNHEDPAIQALACARLGLRSTIEETRGARMLSIASLPWPSYCRGNMPIPLKYSGAHTHRLSGDWKINMQNLPAGRGTNKSKLRKALIAPPGYEVIAGDLAQIEARVNAWICGQKDLLAIFAAGGDAYSILASAIFGFTVDKNVHKTERFIGKGGELGLGFRCGDKKFYAMVVRQARQLGMDVPKLLQVWTPTLAKKAVQTYRHTHSNIDQTWPWLDNVLATAWCGGYAPVQFGPVLISEGCVEGPGGLKMHYDVVCRDPNQELTYRYGKRLHKMHGGVLLENIVQFLARIIIMNAALRLWDRGLCFKLQSHDELVFLVKTEDVPAAKLLLHEELTRRPSWGKDIPLAAEVGSGPSYGDSK